MLLGFSAFVEGASRHNLALLHDAERLRQTNGARAPLLDANHPDVLRNILSTVVHEVGHTLGLRHNFIAQEDGNTSVMAYSDDLDTTSFGHDDDGSSSGGGGGGGGGGEQRHRSTISPEALFRKKQEQQQHLDDFDTTALGHNEDEEENGGSSSSSGGGKRRHRSTISPEALLRKRQEQQLQPHNNNSSNNSKDSVVTESGIVAKNGAAKATYGGHFLYKPGRYDEYAIKYGYTPLLNETSHSRHPKLDVLANGQQVEEVLALARPLNPLFATDEDKGNFFFSFFFFLFFLSFFFLFSSWHQLFVPLYSNCSYIVFFF